MNQQKARKRRKIVEVHGQSTLDSFKKQGIVGEVAHGGAVTYSDRTESHVEAQKDATWGGGSYETGGNKQKKTTETPANDAKQAKLPIYLTNLTNVKFHLTPTREKVLELCRRGLYPSQVARRLSISRSAVSQHIKRLAELGYIDKPALNKTARGGRPWSLDVRWRSIKWILTTPIKLPYDESRLLSGVFISTWRVKDATITTNYGKRQNSLEIACGITEGNTVEEVCRRHDEKCLAVFRWVAEHYPKLKEATNEYAYTINRPGEVNIKPLAGFAKDYYDQYGRLKTEVLKIDRSFGPPELQLLLQGLATREDITKLERKIDVTNTALAQVVDSLNALYNLLKKLIEGNSGTEGGVKPIDKSDERMFR